MAEFLGNLIVVSCRAYLLYVVVHFANKFW